MFAVIIMNQAVPGSSQPVISAPEPSSSSTTNGIDNEQPKTPKEQYRLLKRRFKFLVYVSLDCELLGSVHTRLTRNKD